MPKQKRWQIKRDMDRAVEYIKRAQYQLTKWGSQYSGPHPDYYEGFSALVLILDTAISGINDLRDRI